MFDKLDAERYRWLRSQMAFTLGVGHIGVLEMDCSVPAPHHNHDTDWVEPRFSANVDAAIDAAMKGKP